MSKFTWDRRIARAGELSQTHAAVAQLLTFYRGVARFQKEVYEKLPASSDHSLSVLLPHFPGLLKLVRETGSPALVQAAATLADCTQQDWLELLTGIWQHDAVVQELAPEHVFFANALLQPYAEYLAERTKTELEGAPPVCPFCGSKPQVAVLRPEGDGAKRSLICSLCATEWNFGRVLCPNCGEKHKDHLPIFIASEFDYVRVDACDTCHTYIKSIDLTKNGNAVPVVDELATVSLNLWAAENKYQKLVPNLFGV